ncbi:MAG TPA: hypothetical protein VFC68_06250 [Treponemataceae bacterium]|nr:hypothetical protein [Treponemataceae bacterium]
MEKRERDAIVSTLLFWMLMGAIGGLVLSPRVKESQYKTISIRLDMPVVPFEKKLAQSAIKSEKSTSASTIETRQKTESVQQEELVKKTALPVVKEKPIKTESTPAVNQSAPSQQKLQKSIDELMQEQKKVQSNKKTEDIAWDKMFSNSTKATSSSVSTHTKSNEIESSETLSGAVASIASDSSSSSASSKVAKSKAEASESTVTALQAIGGASFADTRPGSNLTSTVSVVSSMSDATGTTVRMNDGSMRKLLDPSSPVLTIAKENEKLIASSHVITINFIVKADGNVLPTSVSFSPSGLLPLPVQSDLRIQIARWRFEKGISDGQAEFKYSINKR